MIFDWSTYYGSQQGLYAGAGAYRTENYAVTYVADVATGPPIGSLLLMGCGRILIPFVILKQLLSEIRHWLN